MRASTVAPGELRRFRPRPKTAKKGWSKIKHLCRLRLLMSMALGDGIIGTQVRPTRYLATVRFHKTREPFFSPSSPVEPRNTYKVVLLCASGRLTLPVI